MLAITIDHYVGADESNHGRYPEIFVAVSSTHPDDTFYHKEIIPKKRKSCRTQKDYEKAVKEILQCRDLKFLLLYQEHVDCLGINAPKISAYGQLLASFKYAHPTKVLIDGSGNSKQKQDLQHIISKHTSGDHKLRFIKKGDQHFPIINKADNIAYLLFRVYNRLPHGEVGPLDEYRVDFDIKVTPPADTEKKGYINSPRNRR